MIGKFKFRTLPVLAAAVLPAPGNGKYPPFFVQADLQSACFFSLALSRKRTLSSRSIGFAIRLFYHIGIRLHTILRRKKTVLAKSAYLCSIIITLQDYGIRN